MREFKVGDRVTWGHKVYSAVIVEINGVVATMDRQTAIPACYASKIKPRCVLIELTLVEPAPATGPIQTTTVKKLVPGVYGRFEVHEVSGPDKGVCANQRDRNGNFAKHVWYNAQELRESAKHFTELADWLDEQSQT